VPIHFPLQEKLSSSVLFYTWGDLPGKQIKNQKTKYEDKETNSNARSRIIRFEMPWRSSRIKHSRTSRNDPGIAGGG
jgi:hypothetical protein